MPEADTVTIKRPEDLDADMTRTDLIEVCNVCASPTPIAWFVSTATYGDYLVGR